MRTSPESQTVGAGTRRRSAALEHGDRLVAITATGPVYRTDLIFEVAPASVALAFLQELAARAIDERVDVVSTRAKTLKGDAAYSEWLRTCGLMSGWLLQRTPTDQLRFLSEVSTYVGRHGSAQGIEPIVAAALNAAWPWVEPEAFARLLLRLSARLEASEFAAARAIPILDPGTRTFTLFAPGELTKIDVREWLDWRALRQGGRATGPTGPGVVAPAGDDSFGAGILGRLLGPGALGGHGLDLTDLPGPDGGSRGGDTFGAEILAELLGPGSLGGHGLDLGKLPGRDGGSRDNDNFGAEILRRLLGPRGPSLGGLRGADGAGPRSGPAFGDDIVRELLGPGAPGGHGLDLSNVRSNGGPYGFGSALGPGGAADVELFVVALVAAFVAGYYIGKDWAQSHSRPAPTPEERPPVGADRPPPPPKDDHPRPKQEKHLYPDPYGNGGGPTRVPDDDDEGNPTTIWDEFGGGGNPTTLWDEDGGGVNPTTLWDENGGGGNPVTTVDNVSAISLSGRGLLAAVVQVGPRTFAP